MIGALAGDMIGSQYEFHPTDDPEFPLFPEGARFTDDSVLSIAVADALLKGGDYRGSIRSWGRRYFDAGYGGRFRRWLAGEDDRPYGSYGNGSAMRVSALGFTGTNLDWVLAEAGASAAVSHDHPEGIKGAEAVAGAVFLARTGASKEDIRAWAMERFGYRLDRSLAEIGPGYRFDETCQGSVPEALTAFLESTDWLDAVRKAILLGGDADTLACITGGIAQAYYGKIPGWIVQKVRGLLDTPLLEVLENFEARFPLSRPVCI